jgi:HEAT repeat protein
MKDQSQEVRESCASALHKFKLISPEHWEKWHSLLISPEYRTNVAALNLLPMEWTNNVPVVQHARLVGDLKKLLVNDTDEIRSLAAYRLQPLIRSDVTIQSAVIERMQKDTAPKVRYAALSSIRNFLYDSSELESLLVQAAVDPAPEIKAYAMETLAQRSAGKALSDGMLLEATNSSDWRLRINAAWLLAQRKRPESVPVLLAEMEQYGDRRVNTAEYLAQFGPEVLPLLRPQLNSLKISTVKSLFTALALANIREFGPDILAATRHTDPSMRAHALKALSWLKLDNADVRMACETLKNDPDETVRKEAEDCIAFLNQLKKRRRN